MDYITYEFIYPKKKIHKHSNKPQLNSKIDLVRTDINNDLFDKEGTTYIIKNINPPLKWRIKDIYWTTLKILSEKYASDNELKEIEEMYDYLTKDKFFILNDLRDLKIKDSDNNIVENDFDMNNIKHVIDEIDKCDVNLRQYSIKECLLNYYNKIGYSKSYKLNIVYMKNFEYLWEYMMKIILKDDNDFRNNNWDYDYKIINLNDDDISNREFKPDVFSNYNGFKFVADAKYYNNIDSKFDKELYAYNEYINNKYPIIILIPSENNSFYRKIKTNEKELLICLISIEETLNDILNNSYNILNKLQKGINKYSNRKQ